MTYVYVLSDDFQIATDYKENQKLNGRLKKQRKPRRCVIKNIKEKRIRYYDKVAKIFYWNVIIKKLMRRRRIKIREMEL